MHILIFTIFSLFSFSDKVYALSGDARDATSKDRLSSLAKVGGGSGVLISHNIILTAGHVVGFNQDNLDEITISFPESKDPTRQFRIKKLKVAERGIFPTRYLDHSGQDLAVIMVEENVEKILKIEPMELYKKPGSSLIGQKVFLAGYGVATLDSQNRCNGKPSDKLKVAESQVKEFLVEEGRWGAPLIIGKEGLTPCNGDSGAPSYIIKNGKKYAVAITSGPYNPTLGVDIGRSFQYADIGSALSWINKAILELNLKKENSSKVNETSIDNSSRTNLKKVVEKSDEQSNQSNNIQK